MSGLVAPNGVACLGDRLYVASRDRVSTFTLVPGGRLANRADLPIRLPNQAHHGLRYIQAGPDGRLYISIGSPCNICQPEGLQGTIISISPNGGDLRRMAWGIRNSVGFDWNGGHHVFHRQWRGRDGRQHTA